jgi:ribonucleoside-diphosphate reductase alpha chain
MTVGVTERMKTGEGYLYVTINEDETGLCEVFTTIGKAGGNAAAQSEAISRLISLGLRSGIEPREIVKQLKGISGPSPVWDGHGGQILSTPDAIGKVIEHYVENREHIAAKRAPAPAAGAQTAHAAQGPARSVQASSTTCPECGTNVEHVSGCVVCYNCGWSKC